MRVAVAGVNGIGKHHAKWHHLAGAEVVAFLGSSEVSCATGAEALRAIFPFTGRGYSDFGTLLESEKPDIVDICLPNELHFEYGKMALNHGCHVLCEKPLVWGLEGDPEGLVAQGRELVDLAGRLGLRLGMCSQYASAISHYKRLHEACYGPMQAPATFYAEMDTLARGRQRSPEEIWIDMGPHPLSLLLAWMPHGVIRPETLDVSFNTGQAHTRFTFFDPTQEQACECEVIVRDLAEGKPQRRFGINDFIVDCEGRADETGAYRCVLRAGANEDMGDDFMALHIGQFLACVEDPRLELLVPGEIGVRSIELQLQILQRA